MTTISDPHGIRARRDKRKLTQRQLAAMVSEKTGYAINYQAIQRLEKGRAAGGSDTSRILGSVMSVLDELEGRPSVNVMPFAPLARPVFSTEDRISVYALRENAAKSGVEMSNMILSNIPRPEFLASVPEAYAIEQRGTDMVPMYRPGYILAVHPYTAPRPETGVLIMDEARQDVRVCEYVGEDDDNWLVKKYGKNPSEFAISKASHPLCHCVCAVITLR